MREIKFRAWDGNTMWHQGFSVSPSGNIEEHQHFFDDGIVLELMQYTGLKDKNGKEIYEGDLLSNGVGVIWSKYAFVPAYDYGRSDDFEDWGTDWSKDVEVIGNIYENPELLK